MTQLLIAYDGSPSAATAVRAAASLFPAAHASIATVPPDPAPRVAAAFSMHGIASPTAVTETIDALSAEARREADEATRQAVEQARALGLDAEPVTVPPSGPAWSTLLDFAHRLAADVLVCGSRGRGAFARTLLGSTSSSLLHQTDLPLLVVPDGGGALDGPVVLAYDGSEAARHAIGVVGRVLSGRAAVVVHAWEPMFHRGLAADALAAGAVDRLGETIQDLRRALADSAAATTQDGVTIARVAPSEPSYATTTGPSSARLPSGTTSSGTSV
jgi:nucleotide-binding universal stress UspA family protein